MDRTLAAKIDRLITLQGNSNTLIISNQQAELNLLNQILEQSRKQSGLLEEIRDALVDPIADKIIVYLDGKEAMETRIITTDEQIDASIGIVSAGGHPAKVQEGSIKWNQDNENCLITVSPDGLSARIVAVKAPGVTVFNVEADADLGDEVKTIKSEDFSIETRDAQAAGFRVVLGQPTPQTPPTA